MEAADGHEEKSVAHASKETGGERDPHQGKLIGQGQDQPEPGDDREQGRGERSSARLRNPVGNQDGPQVD